MEREMKMARNVMRYVLPILGALGASMLLRRVAARQARAESKEQMLLRASRLDIQGAMNAALKHVPGTPVEAELGEEHGMPVWEVQIVPRRGGPTREVLIDAKSGDVLEMKLEFPEEVHV